METKGKKPSLGWAILSLALPVAMILYGTLIVGVRPPVLPLIGAVALAGLMGLKDIVGKTCRKGCLRRSGASRSPSPSLRWWA